MRVRGCDRKCGSCALLGLCGGIEQYGVKGYHCFEAGCELEFPAIKRMQECSACGVGKLTWDFKDEEVAGLVDEVANLGKVKVQPIELPGVVPIVSLKDPSSYNFDPLKIEAIAVMFEDLFDEEFRKEVEKAGDIHSYNNENPPKVPAELISEKMQELFPGVEWGGDLERIRRMLGRKEKG